MTEREEREKARERERGKEGVSERERVRERERGRESVPKSHSPSWFPGLTSVGYVPIRGSIARRYVSQLDWLPVGERERERERERQCR